MFPSEELLLCSSSETGISPEESGRDEDPSFVEDSRIPDDFWASLLESALLLPSVAPQEARKNMGSSR